MNPLLSKCDIVFFRMSFINLYGTNSGSRSKWLKIIKNWLAPEKPNEKTRFSSTTGIVELIAETKTLSLSSDSVAPHNYWAFFFYYNLILVCIDVYCHLLPNVICSCKYSVKDWSKDFWDKISKAVLCVKLVYHPIQMWIPSQTVAFFLKKNCMNIYSTSGINHTIYVIFWIT